MERATKKTKRLIFYKRIPSADKKGEDRVKDRERRRRKKPSARY